MAATKRARPAFSPPRPNKAKRKDPTAKPKGTEKKRGRPSKSTSNAASKRTSNRRTSISSAHSSESHSNSDASPASPHSSPSHSPLASSSPSPSPSRSQSPSTHSNNLPDAVLVAPLSPSTTTSARIPDALIHHITSTHFKTSDSTKLSKDARTLLGVYVDTFVREGLHRCVLEKEREEIELAGDGGGAGGVRGGRDVRKGRDGAVEVGSEGWLEVGDLERVAVQLVLDF